MPSNHFSPKIDLHPAPVPAFPFLSRAEQVGGVEFVAYLGGSWWSLCHMLPLLAEMAGGARETRTLCG